MVKDGYKQTEVGVIPEDWGVTLLGLLIEEKRKITYGIVVPGPFIPNGVPLIRSQDYSKGWVNLDNLYRVSHEIDKSYSRSRVAEGDVLLTIVGSVGKVTKVPCIFAGSNITQQTARLAFNPKIADAGFYRNVFLSEMGVREIKNYTKSGVQPSLNLSDVAIFNVPFPPFAEQEAIAGALSDADGLIESLEQLIHKKRQLKQGAMQDLLSPWEKANPAMENGEWKMENDASAQHSPLSTIRSPLKKGWVEKTLGELFVLKNGLNKSKEHFGFGVPIVNYMDVYNNSAIDNESLKGRVSLSNSEIENYRVKKGDVFFTRTSETVDEIGLAAVYLKGDNAAVFSGFVLRARPTTTELNSNYLGYSLRSADVRQQIIPKASYTTRALINSTALKTVRFRYPEKTEQTRIATILSDMDTEISTLETKLSKAKQIKQGMMQELLTGKTRLI